MICHECGHENLPDSQFCGRCGVDVLPNAPEEPAELSPRELDTDVARFAPSAASEPAPPASLWQRLVMGLAAAVLLVIGVFYIWQTGGLWLIYHPVGYLSSGPHLLALLIVLAGAGFGFATVRPPGGNLRRIIVGFAILATVLGLAAVALVIVIFVYFRGIIG